MWWMWADFVSVLEKILEKTISFPELLEIHRSIDAMHISLWLGPNSGLWPPLTSFVMKSLILSEYCLHMGPTTCSRKLTMVVKTSRIYLYPNTSIPGVNRREPESLRMPGWLQAPSLPSTEVQLYRPSLFYSVPYGPKVAAVCALCVKYQHYKQKWRNIRGKRHMTFLRLCSFICK